MQGHGGGFNARYHESDTAVAIVHCTGVFFFTPRVAAENKIRLY